MKAIQVKYLGATNNRGSRVKAWTEGGNSVIIPFPYESKCFHKNAALALCVKMHWPTNIIGGGLPNGDYVYVFAGE